MAKTVNGNNRVGRKENAWFRNAQARTLSALMNSLNKDGHANIEAALQVLGQVSCLTFREFHPEDVMSNFESWVAFMREELNNPKQDAVH